LVALSIGIAAYLKVPEERIELAPPATDGEKFKGPIYAGTGTGYIIEFENGIRFYFAGDTCLFGDMKFVIGDYYKPDAAFLPIGNVYTMDAKQAAIATVWINPKYVLPYHYHTFPELTQSAEEFVNQVEVYRSMGNTTAEAIILTPGEEKEIEGIKVLWLGHATMLLESVNGSRIMIDPWLEANPDCPSNYKNITTLGHIDLILLTHGHIDHLTYEELNAIAGIYQPAIIAQWELGIYLQDHVSVPIALMNIGGTLTKEKLLDQGFIPPEIINSVKLDGIKITMVQAQHSSSPP
jgi:L-ascorbate metabolism protein UlaG (beta-lactamase superfamily)